MSGWESRVWSSWGQVVERKVLAMAMICSLVAVVRGMEVE